MSHKQKLLVMALAAALILTNIMMLNRLDNVRNEITQLQNYINMVSSDVSGIREGISRINERDRLISYHNYNVVNLDEKYDKAKVEFDVSFNKLPADAKAYVMYKEEGSDDNSWLKAELSNKGGLNYLAVAELSHRKNYAVQVVVESGDERMSEQLSALDLERKISERIKVGAYPSQADSSGNLTYNVNVVNFHQGNEAFKLKSISCTVYYKDKVIDKADVLAEGRDEKNPHDPNLENWSYDGSCKVEGAKGMDYMKDITIEAVAVDGLGKEYRYKYEE